jgi:class III poly(R)-hydroxyalkanoic acid synthase PhaE subunit
MPDESKTGSDPADLMSLWIQTASDFCGTMLRNWSHSVQDDPAVGSDTDPTAKSRTQESLEAVLKTWQTLSSAAGDPGSMDVFSKLTHALPDVMQKMVVSAWQGYFQIQQQWLEKAGRIGQTTQAYSFENLDQETFKSWTQIYENEFRQFFSVPQLGLTRFYQEKFNQTLDRFNRFQNAFAEYLQMFFLPMEKSFKALQDEINRLADEGKLTEDYNTYYRLWIKILEGHYMTLYKSPEYVMVMSKTLDALVEYLQSRDAITQDVLKMMAIPTQKDLDELYREIYQLKKKIRTLEKKP